MFWAKSVLPILLWVSLLWFLFTGKIHLPGYGLVRRDEDLAFYMFLVALTLAIAVTFTGALLGYI